MLALGEQEKGNEIMSYCRWSSDDYQCDVYVYESHDGYQLHVAGTRRTPAEPFPPFVNWHTEGWEKWHARDVKVTEMLDACPRSPIGLPHDGETFEFGEPGECADQLVELKAMGYNVPQYAIDALREEQAEETDVPD